MADINKSSLRLSESQRSHTVCNYTNDQERLRLFIIRLCVTIVLIFRYSFRACTILRISEIIIIIIMNLLSQKFGEN